MTNLIKEKSQIVEPTKETILVLKRNDICSEELWTGFKKSDLSQEIATVKDKAIFMFRPEAETDTRYKQIIPYLIFTHNNKYFLMQRRATASEQRLASKYSFGIGGHIRKEDIKGNSLLDWALREFYEEVNYSGKLEEIPLGILNDDSTDVGKVHIGFAILLKGDSEKISIKSELKNGQLLTLEECKSYYDTMETWSQMIFNVLKNN